jgi:hypothetical protein
MSMLEEVRAKAAAHEKQTGHQVTEEDTSSYDEVGIAVVCKHCDWFLSEEWPRGQEGPTADCGEG